MSEEQMGQNEEMQVMADATVVNGQITDAVGETPQGQFAGGQPQMGMMGQQGQTPQQPPHGMEVTVSEAMRLRKEISTAINQATSSVSRSAFGQHFEEGVLVSDEEQDKFQDVIEKFQQLLRMSWTLNNILDAFNVRSGVTSQVRARNNRQLLMGIYQNALMQSRPSKKKEREVLDSEIKQVEREYKPFQTKAELKQTIAALKADIRQFQGQIDSANATKVQVPFTYADMEAAMTCCEIKQTW
jgi:hypothetical protein